MFEPIHGSAPKYRGMNSANPIAAIEAGRMLLDHIGEPRAAQRIGAAVRHVLETGRIRSLSAGVHKTDEVGDIVLEAMEQGVGVASP
jgi:isocitrate/isopropylmalate dehydrogenase